MKPSRAEQHVCQQACRRGRAALSERCESTRAVLEVASGMREAGAAAVDVRLGQRLASSHGRKESPMKTRFRCILVPHDFSETADRALTEAAALARDTGGRLRVLHVVAPPTMPVDLPLPDPFDLVPGQRLALEQRVQRVLGPGAPPTSVAVEVGIPAERILEEAARADSIVMGTEGRTGLSHFLLGSVTKRVMQAAPVPVLTIRAAHDDRQRRGRGAAKRAAA